MSWLLLDQQFVREAFRTVAHGLGPASVSGILLKGMGGARSTVWV